MGTEPHMPHPLDVPEVRLPSPRGPLSEWVLHRLRGADTGTPPPCAGVAGLDDDLQLALYLAYEPHYSDLPGVAADAEWDPALLAFRSRLEHAFGWWLRDEAGPCGHDPIEEVVPALLAADDGPSVSSHIEHHGTLDDMRDVVRHRSLYQLKEGDAHTFGIPRLGGRAKQLLAEIQAGEYGADAPGREMHATLFATTMRALGLDDRLHAHLGTLPGTAMAISNLISLFGLNRRWRGALVGHLACFEMSSVVPMGRYARGLERMGAPAEARRFYEVHTLADAEHEVLALEMAAACVEAEPHLRADVEFGVRAVLLVERHYADDLFERFRHRTLSAAA